MSTTDTTSRGMELGRLLHWEWSQHDESNDRLLAFVAKAPSDDLWSQSVARSFARPFGKVEVHTASSYLIPEPVRRLAGEERATELQNLFSVLKELNDSYEGWNARDLHVVLNCDPVVLAIQSDFMAWMTWYATMRLQRVFPGIVPCPVKAFQYVFKELGPFINDLSRCLTSMHCLVLQGVENFFTWELATRTWLGSHVTFRHQPNKSVSVFTDFHDDARRDAVSRVIQLQKWCFDDLPVRLAVRLADACGAVPAAPLDEPTVLAHLKNRAEDIMEMRPLLIRNFNAMKTAVEVVPDVWVAFRWSLHHHLGTIFVGDSERDVTDQWNTSLFRGLLALRPDGLIAYDATPWITGRYLDAYLPVSVLAANVAVVDALHERLLSFWTQIDVDAVLRRLRPQVAAGELAVEDEEEFVAATIQKAIENEAQKLVHGRVVRSLRLSALKKILTALGCEVASAKGSEIKVYRPGGRIYTLGRHQKDPQIHASLIQRLLHRLEFSLEDWVRVTTR